MNEWRPSAALFRACLVAGCGVVIALLLGAPGAVVLVAPFGVHAVLGLRSRPVHVPKVTETLRPVVLVEGQGARSTLSLGSPEAVAEIEHLVRVTGVAPHVVLHPATGILGGAPARVSASLEVGPRRWGRRTLAPSRVQLSSTWAAWTCGPVQVPGGEITTLPSTAAFASHAEAPLPHGLVGLNRSRRNGEGTEFSGIRVFHAGDRLRRINWRVSLRTGELNVVTTRAEEDTGVLLLVDGFSDHGASGGIGGAESSLDLTVRAAAALAEHHLRAGDRVGLRVLGGSSQVLLPGSGMRHLRRVLGTLARLVPADAMSADVSRLHFRVAAGTVVIVLTPVLHEGPVQAAGVLARRGLPVLVVDTLPQGAQPAPSDERDPRIAALAWRMRQVERRNLLAQVVRTGTPVVAWRGPGTLDAVLHRMARQASLPREAVR